jgi:hypothetical protein
MRRATRVVSDLRGNINHGASAMSGEMRAAFRRREAFGPADLVQITNE